MLNKKQHYLQIALNSTLNEAKGIIDQVPLDERIIIEAGTPLIKAYGASGIRAIRSYWERRLFGPQPGFERPRFSPISPWWLRLLAEAAEKRSKMIKGKSSRGFLFSRGGRGNKVLPRETKHSPYIIADLKCMDRGAREVEIALRGRANAVTALGRAPIETLDAFIEKCEGCGLDAMIDMMNVDFPLNILRQLKKIPSVVILHRGVDEEAFNLEKEIPFHEIQRIKSNYDIMIAVAGGDTFKEARRAIFNDADIVVVWKSFYKSSADTAKLAEEFLKEIR